MKQISVIGGGFGGLSSAAILAKRGYKVTLFEKNDETGGRARYFSDKGYRFDMGPSWYLMPEVFDTFFAHFNAEPGDYYDLIKLDPTYRVFFNPGEYVDIQNNWESVSSVFESFEKGGSARLRAYLDQAEYKYDIALKQFLYKEYRKLSQFFNKTLIVNGTRLQVFSKLDKIVQKYVKDRRARQILEYAMVFLGTDPVSAPSLYSLLSHVDINQGVYYPKEGLAGVAQAITRLAREQGVEIRTSTPVTKIIEKNGKAAGVEAGGEIFPADAVLVNADYAHAEMELMPSEYRTYSKKYWDSRVLAPSMFIMFLGLHKRAENLVHHNLYFMEDWTEHFDTIFKKPSWPDDPCFYLSAISKTDTNAAPEGCENLFLLVPAAAGLADTDEVRDRYAESLLDHVEHVTGESITPYIDTRRIYSQRDFKKDYNALEGTALGLSHTLFQTAYFRPQFRSKKLKNCFFCGQYTHPGVGVPMVLIAAEVAVDIISKEV